MKTKQTYRKRYSSRLRGLPPSRNYAVNLLTEWRILYTQQVKSNQKN